MATVLLRIPHRSRTLNGWDSILFALGLEEYDVMALRPHSPGYPVYVALGRVFQVFFHEANASLVALGIFLSAVAVAFLYATIRELGSVRAAVLGCVLFVVAPIFTFNGLIALSYVAEGAFSAVLAWTGLRHIRRPSLGSAVALGALWALAAGVRQSAVLFLGPLVVFAIYVASTSWKGRLRHAGAAATAAGLTGLAWFVPMVLSTTHGLNGWLLAARIQGGSVILAESVFVRGLDAAREHFARIGFFLQPELRHLVPVLLTVLLIAFFVRGGIPRATWARAFSWPRWATLFVAAWILPSLLFYLFIFSGWQRGPTGYVLVFLPGLYALFAWLMDATVRATFDDLRWPRVRRAQTIVLAAVLLYPVPGLVDAQEPWLQGEIRAHDEWSRRWDGIREEFPPTNTTILTSFSWGHVKWYFPEYLMWGYFPIPRNDEAPRWELILETRYHHDDVLFYEAHARDAPGAPHAIPPWSERIILFDFQLAGENDGRRVLREDIPVHEAHLKDGWRLLYIDRPPGNVTVESLLRPQAEEARGST